MAGPRPLVQPPILQPPANPTSSAPHRFSRWFINLLSPVSRSAFTIRSAGISVTSTTSTPRISPPPAGSLRSPVWRQLQRKVSVYSALSQVITGHTQASLAWYGLSKRCGGVILSGRARVLTQRALHADQHHHGHHARPDVVAAHWSFSGSPRFQLAAFLLSGSGRLPSGLPRCSQLLRDLHRCAHRSILSIRVRWWMVQVSAPRRRGGRPVLSDLSLLSSGCPVRMVSVTAPCPGTVWISWT